MTDLRDLADFRRKQLRESFACAGCGSPDPARIDTERAICSDCHREAFFVVVEANEGFVVEAEVAS